MTAAVDNKGVAVIDQRARVVALRGKMRERARDIETGERPGAILDFGALGHHAGNKPLEDLQLEPERAVGGAGDFGFEFAQLRGGETDLAGQRLPVDEDAVEGRRHQFLAVLRRHLDEIAQHVVVLDPEDANAGVFGVARLQGGNDAARFIAQRARFIER